MNEFDNELILHSQLLGEGVHLIIASAGHDRSVNQFFQCMGYPCIRGPVGVFHKEARHEKVLLILKAYADVCYNKTRHHEILYETYKTMNDEDWTAGTSVLLDLINADDFHMKRLCFDLHIDNLQQDMRDFQETADEQVAKENFLQNPFQKCPQSHVDNESICSLCAGLPFDDMYRRRREEESPGLKLILPDEPITPTQSFEVPPSKKYRVEDTDERRQIETLESKGYFSDFSCCFSCNVLVNASRQYCRKTYCENLGFFFTGGQFHRVSSL